MPVFSPGGRRSPRQRAVRWVLAAALAAGATSSLADSFFDARVVAVVDGDTIEVLTAGEERLRVRLAGIDTPERGQPWSRRARQALSARVFGKPVRINRVATDRYGRTVGEVYADNVCVGCELVRAGHAWVYRGFSDDPILLALEADARENERGLWALPEAQRTPPWEWRAAHRRQAGGAEPPPRTNASDAPAFTCGAKQYCREMTGCEEARFHLRECGLARLDGDGDGVPCEALCAER